MTEPYIRPEDVSPHDAEKILDFLNAAQSAQEIADAVEIAHERDVGVKVGQRILDRREELGGFTSLRQVADVPQVGAERFTEIVITLRGEPKEGVSTVSTTMKWPTLEIGSYVYTISTNGVVIMHLFDTSGSRVAQIGFSEGGGGSASPDRDGVHYWSMNISSLPSVIDMLRNEGPCRLVYTQQGDQPQQLWGVGTGKEPIGEGEMLAP